MGGIKSRHLPEHAGLRQRARRDDETYRGETVLISPTEGVLKQYELAVAYVLHQDARRWNLINVYVVVQGVLIATLFSNSVFRDPLAFNLVCGIGIISGVFWWLILWRSTQYLLHRVGVARRLQTRLPDAVQDCLFWPNGSLTMEWDGRMRWLNPLRISMERHIKANTIIYSLIVLTMLFWLASAWHGPWYVPEVPGGT